VPIAPWRAALAPASYNGVVFNVDIDEKSSGRRLVPHEFPKRDTPYTEDMGRRARHYTVMAYIIQGPENGYDYRPNRDALVAQLEAEGPGQLVHPTLGTDTVEVDTYRLTERRELGGMAEFEIVFIEAGSQISTTPITDTVSTAIAAATNAIMSFGQSSDITGLVGN
jgi:prophage DNA circulation protein